MCNMTINYLALTREIVGTRIFFERPSDKYEANQRKDCRESIENRIGACDLFSLFTADVIKLHVLFIR